LAIYCRKYLFDNLRVIVIDYEHERVQHHRFINFTFQNGLSYQQKHEPVYQRGQKHKDIFDHINRDTFDPETNDQTLHRIHHLFS